MKKTPYPKMSIINSFKKPIREKLVHNQIKIYFLIFRYKLNLKPKNQIS